MSPALGAPIAHWLAEPDTGPEDLLARLTPAVAAGRPGFPEAITAVLPRTTVQPCSVQRPRISLRYCAGLDRQAGAGELPTIVRALTAEVGGRRLDQFAASALGKQ